jgi:hypothetical protein
VRVVFLEPPQEALDLLDRRRRWGADRWDEMWNGVLHVDPLPCGADGEHRSDVLGITLRSVDGKLEISWTAAPPPSERAAKPGCGPGIGWSA